MSIFNSDHLMSLASAHHDAYQQAIPFPHITFDNFMDAQRLEQALAAFPQPQDLDFYRYDNPLEKKLAFDQVVKLPPAIASILYAMNQPVFLRFLEKLTGIEGLIPDPYYRGGGIHQIPRGGKLDIHLDFNKYEKLGLERRLNVLLYLNKDWQESYGGYFELWQGEKKGNNCHQLIKCVQRILPLFNRLAIFSTSEHSYHGHPDPLNCPVGQSRKSIAVYYYTASRPKQEVAAAHSTVFLKRPQDPSDDEIERLRQQRNQGRLVSNVKNDFIGDK